MDVDEIVSGIFRIEVPLPGNPLRSINSYAIRGRERDLIVDTGMRRDECRTALLEGLRVAGIDRSNADLFITHLHIDHLGLAKDVAAPGATVYLGAADIEVLRAWKDGWEPVLVLAGVHGFPVEAFRELTRNDRGLAFDPTWVPALRPAGEGMTLAVGDYRFRAVATPGHSPGHTCLYEPNARILLTGDHVLGEISPNITGWTPGLNPLETYLKSLDKVRGLDVRLALPGHRAVIRDLDRRIEELKRHHDTRLREVERILARGTQSAYEVAGQMSWDLKVGSWQDWPLAQRWFATGEALSHLRCLEGRGEVRRERRGDREWFSAR